MEVFMDFSDKENKKEIIKGFKYSIIAELCNPNLSKHEIQNLIKEKAERDYEIPFSSKQRISKATIRNWLKQLQNYGMDGLIPKTRMDHGVSRNLSEEEQAVFLDYLEKHPELTAVSVIKKLRKTGKINNHISKSALSRMVLSAGLAKKNRLRNNSGEEMRKFNFRYPLECVQADNMHDFLVRDSKGKKRKAILTAFIDDATRRIVYANFSFTEKAREFEKGLKHILLCYGKPSRVYVDNGSTFVATQTKRILTSLGIPITHSRPYKPMGRGKIERFFRTLRGQFLRLIDQASIGSLDELNVQLHNWLEHEYHRNAHSGLDGLDPLAAWLGKAKYLTPLDPSINIDEAFLHQKKRKIYNDATFTLNGVLYEAPSILIGKSITVRFDNLRKKPIASISFEGKNYGEAHIVDAYANTKVSRNVNQRANVVREDEVKNEQSSSQEKTDFHITATLAASKRTTKTKGDTQ